MISLIIEAKILLSNINMIATVKNFLAEHKKYTPVIFFMGGFIWDSLTLGRIDGWYSTTILFLYLLALTVSIYLFNLKDDGKWENTFLEPYQEYTPLVIQFFLGGLSSAYVIFFFQSVSLTKTMVFFLILVVLLLSNELLKHRISNKYLQFGAYYFVTFTFFIFFMPILFGIMNSFIFFLSGVTSLVIVISVIRYIYNESPSTREEINEKTLGGLIIGIYLFVNICYYFNLIPPVPLALKDGFVAHHVDRTENTFLVTYERASVLPLFNSSSSTFHYSNSDSVFVYTSIFAPSDLKKSVYHNWKWYNPETQSWNISDRIGFEVSGGRKGGFRGYTYKENIWPGQWQVDVITGEGLVLGEISFKIVQDSTFDEHSLHTRKFE